MIGENGYNMNLEMLGSKSSEENMINDLTGKVKKGEGRSETGWKRNTRMGWCLGAISTVIGVGYRKWDETEEKEECGA